MTLYDSWTMPDDDRSSLCDPYILSGPTPAQMQEEFHALPPRLRFKARRMAKRSTQRRKNNTQWYRRQRREDHNGQVSF